MSAADDFERANEPWDGVWRVKKPDDYVSGLYRLHQITADHLLRQCRDLTYWEARFLQVVRYQGRGLSDIQLHHLRQLELRHEPRWAA